MPSHVEVLGFVETSPRLTRSQKLQFQLKAFQISGTQQPQDGTPLPFVAATTGQAYVTIPLLWGTGVYPGQLVSIRGRLYAPQPADNPGGFDFQAYLAQQGIFVGLGGERVSFPENEGRFVGKRSPVQNLLHPLQHWLWNIRQRIVRTHVTGLGVPAGPLMSAMLLGKGGVDVPFPVKDAFANVGLAHALAASGFQVSLLVGIMLWLTQSLGTGLRVGICVGTLALYIGLTGLEASVMRAGLMGCAVLLATVSERKVNPFGSLLLAAVVLLAMNPLWVWDLGFQLSFVATLALLVTVPALMRRLDWMPVAIASLIAVPLAAYIWTLPLQLHVFGVMSPYSIGLNVVTSSLITLISAGSAIAALLGFFSITLGSWVAKLFYFPTHGLIGLAEWVSSLPGNNFSAGTITPLQVITLYALYVLVLGIHRLRRSWWLVGVLCIALVAIPAAMATNQRFQVTVLATRDRPLLVLQKQGEVGIIGTPNPQDARFTVVPFLQKQGINAVDWAISFSPPADNAGWQTLTHALPLHNFYIPASATNVQPHFSIADRFHPLPLGEAIPVGSTPVRLVSLEPLVLRFQVGDRLWLLIDPLDTDTLPLLQANGRLSAAHILCWSGELETAAGLDIVQPEVAIASTHPLSPALEQWFQQHTVTLFSTERDGAVQWTPDADFYPLLSADAE
ncbi:ComEC/Rec2 family competence protein [filamentous cyanobacterium LEGE 07170]|nr:ComEC/Rec2 family competence protein [filamentous cyanobacterium LEGE 07170]